jgi:hypothetical protein
MLVFLLLFLPFLLIKGQYIGKTLFLVLILCGPFPVPEN